MNIKIYAFLLVFLSIHSMYSQPPIKKIQSPSQIQKIKDINLFEKVKLQDEQAQDEINFWGRQMSEHALFLSLGLESQELKDEAQKLHNLFEDFMANYSYNYNDILPLLKNLKEFKEKILTKLNTGEWIGWIYPALVEHMLLELSYFVNKLNAIPYSVEDEKVFWDEEHKGQSLATAHLLDPLETETVEKAFEIAKKFEEKKPMQNNQEMMILLSLKNSKELDAFNKEGQEKAKKGKLRSIIHPVLIEHEIREVERSIQTFEKLKSAAGYE